MKNINYVNKVISIFLIILLAFCITEPVYARGGCFAQGTPVLTSQGHKPIEKLNKADSIVTYNFTTHQLEIGKIGEIKLLTSHEYLLINNKIRVTETHPFYIKTDTGVKLKQAQKLEIGDQLIGEGDSRIFIFNIDHIKENITVYNLISVNPNHNFYANGILVHNKGGGGGTGGGGGGYYRGGNGNSSFTPINSKTLPKYLLILLVLFAGLLPVIFCREIYNLTHLFNKEFTNDSDLIKFATNINSKFTNRYSLKYSKDKEQWKQILIQFEIGEQEYQQIISKNHLIEEINSLFIKYQMDWTMKDFEHMLDYISKPFYYLQYYVFQRDFGTSFDIIYQPEVIEAAPISYKQEDNQHIFRVQVNGKMTNFVISSEGYVLSGEPFPRLFSEYWDISVNSSGKWYLVNITSL
ncbi:Hint domain-containing protein [Nostoc sp. DedQUE09]|uniref:Hint domain-containing protein n=1 Tax=Nostoc sp. DedQUE09 TaxID=3075394 RepID=UPI002AD384BD|nr:Hint domain-containing protein [Nostoc sp. DedQUE09]MDZ7954831.1 Hint domain-containing protein [Nostoc sp. DedQUE09]